MNTISRIIELYCLWGFTEVPVRLRTPAGRYPLASRSPLARFPCLEPTVQAHTALAGISGGQRTLQALPQATFSQVFGAAVS